MLACPPGHRWRVRAEETVAGRRVLLACHPRHRTTDPDGVAQQLQEQLFEVGQTQEGDVTVLPLHHPRDDRLDWFLANGPRLGEVHSLVAPDLDVCLPLAWKELVQKGHQDLYSGMGAIVDPEDAAGPDVPRDPALTHDSWLRSRLSSLHRGGLANDPQQLLAMYTVGFI